jgi:hypothetical protein
MKKARNPSKTGASRILGNSDRPFKNDRALLIVGGGRRAPSLRGGGIGLNLDNYKGGKTLR